MRDLRLPHVLPKQYIKEQQDFISNQIKQGEQKPIFSEPSEINRNQTESFSKADNSTRVSKTKAKGDKINDETKIKQKREKFKGEVPKNALKIIELNDDVDFNFNPSESNEKGMSKGLSFDDVSPSRNNVTTTRNSSSNNLLLMKEFIQREPISSKTIRVGDERQNHTPSRSLKQSNPDSNQIYNFYN
jgi:hypothetical protein